MWIQQSGNTRRMETTSRPNSTSEPGSRRRWRSLGSSLRASSGNSAGQRDSGKPGAGGGLARLSLRTSGACLPSLTWRRAGRGTAVWSLVFQRRWRGGGGGCRGSDSAGSSSANRRWISPIPFKRVARATAAKHFRVHRSASASVLPTANWRRLGSRAGSTGGAPRTDGAGPSRFSVPGWEGGAE